MVQSRSWRRIGQSGAGERALNFACTLSARVRPHAWQRLKPAAHSEKWPQPLAAKPLHLYCFTTSTPALFAYSVSAAGQGGHAVTDSGGCRCHRFVQPPVGPPVGRCQPRHSFLLNSPKSWDAPCPPKGFAACRQLCYTLLCPWPRPAPIARPAWPMTTWLRPYSTDHLSSQAHDKPILLSPEPYVCPIAADIVAIGRLWHDHSRHQAAGG